MRCVCPEVEKKHECSPPLSTHLARLHLEAEAVQAGASQQLVHGATRGAGQGWGRMRGWGVRREERGQRVVVGGGGSAPAGAGPPLSLSRATRPHRVPRPHRISHTAPSFHTHPNTSGLYTGTASWTWPKWPAQAAPPSPHVPHRSPGASGPMAGSYRPPGTGWPKLSRATGEVMRLTDRRRTWKGGGGTREGGLSRQRKAGAERSVFFFSP